jgi:hypothetical protein
MYICICIHVYTYRCLYVNMYKGIYVYSHRQNYGNEQGSSGAVSQKGSERSDEIAFDL